jgi:hypothetical protein
MNPTPSDVHVNAPLTNLSIAYLQDQNEFVSDKVFPNLPVQKQSDRYYTYPKGQWFRSDAQERGLSQESAGTGYDVDNTPTYDAHVFALHKDIDDQLRANADSPLNLDAEATEIVTRGLLLKREKDFASKFFTTGVWSTESTPGTKWNASGSTPIKTIREKIAAIKAATAIRPNTLLLAEDAWVALQDNADFLDRITITKDKIVTVDLLASILGLERVMIAAAVENTAKEGVTPAMSHVFTDAALLAYAAPRPGLMTPSAGLTFSWANYLGAGANGLRILRFRIDQLRSDRIEGEMAYDQKVVATDLGHFFYNVLA